MMVTASPLRMPGATLMTRLKVYDTVAPDGQRGGTPHVHLLCSEMYLVLAGQGAVEMIDEGGFRSVCLNPHDALLFSPGTIHRLINPHGTSEILVIMANSGLPERGDNVVCFAPEWMGDQARYDEAMRVASLAEAYQRRDRGVQGFLALKAAFDASEEAGGQALHDFYARAAQRTHAQHAAWEQIIRESVQEEARATERHLQALYAGELGYLSAARQHLMPAGRYRTTGFCGHLDRYFDPGQPYPRRSRPPMTPYRTAIIGTGQSVNNHIEAVRYAGERVHRRAAVDLDPARVEAICQAHDIPRGYTDVGPACWTRRSPIWYKLSHRTTPISR